MQLFYHWNTDQDAYGPLTPGEIVYLPVYAPVDHDDDEQTPPVYEWQLMPVKVPDGPDNNVWWEHVTTGTGTVEAQRIFNDAAKTVTSQMVEHVRTLEEAQTQKEQEIEARATQAVTGGIPVTVNGTSALLAYEQRDRDSWMTWSIGDTLDPGEKFTVRTLTPVNNKYRLPLGNESHLDAGAKAIRKHINAVTAAWDMAMDDVEAATTVTEVDAIDVESYPWPANELP